MDEVHGPNIVRSGSCATIVAQFRLASSLRRLVAQLKAQLVVNPMSSLQVDLPPFATQEDMDAPVPVADARLENLLDAGFDAGLVATTGFVMVGRTIEFQDAARPPDRHAPCITNRRRQLAAYEQALQFPADDVLEHLAIQRQVRDDLL